MQSSHSRWSRFARPWLRASRTGLVLVSAVIVASMVASVALGPIGDRVFAQDADGGDPVQGFLAAIFGGPDRTPTARPADRRQMFTGWRDNAPLAAPLAARRFGTPASWRAPSPRRGRDGRHGLLTAAVPESGRTPFMRQAVCVRLCDGFYFPMGAVRDRSDTNDQASLCSGLCPGAPTRLFVTHSAGDDIEQATAVSNGQAYEDLPVAFAHTRAVGPTCACNPSDPAMAATVSPLRDFTLRRGDSIMTPVGWRVFKGARHWPFRRGDFQGLRSATNLPPKTRAMLARIEDASLGRREMSVAPRPLLVTRRVHLAATSLPEAAVEESRRPARTADRP